MKKRICVLACVFALMLAGCRMQFVPPNPETSPSQRSENSTPDPGGTSESDPVITNTAPNQTGDKNNPGTDDPSGIDPTGFQKEMNVQHTFRLHAVCKTELGYYLSYDAFLYFLDGATGNMTAVCARPECGHTDDTCNAFINSGFLSYYQGKLYYENGDVKSDSMQTLYSVKLDGTEHTKIQRLQLEFMPYRTVWGEPILVSGNLYFLEGDTQIYTVPLGQDVSTAVLIFEDDMTHTLESEWKFWADGGEVYAMNHILDSTGTYQDILYRLGATQSETREIWRSTEIELSYKNDSISSWYITNGHLYYYFSGNDLWDIALGTGKAEKIISLTDTLKNGTALFTDSCVLFLDDQPDSRWAGQSTWREGGKKLTVYDYSGNLLGEVSLTSLYEKYSYAFACSLVFADGSYVYLLLDRGMYMSTSNLLVQVDWEKGSIYEITNWPGADVIYEDKPPNEVELSPITAGGQ